MTARVLAVFGDAPIVFFAVVIGIALTFRIAVGAIRDPAVPDPVAPSRSASASASADERGHR